MIFVVTGKQGEGKTTWVMNLTRMLLKEFIQVGGICSIGSWEKGNRDQFHVIDLESGHSSLLCNRVNEGQDIPFRHFYFKQDGVDFGLFALKKTRFTHPDVLIIDEVGGFELENRGWSSFLETLQDTLSGIVVMVVRESLVEKVIARWKMVDCRLIHISDGPPEKLLLTILQRETDFDKNRRMPVTGIILAGGKSSRFGIDKGLVKFRDKPLISIAIERFHSLCDHMIISANTDTFHHLGYPVIPDAVNDCGPMMGIYSCLKHSSTRVNLVAPVDTPLVPTGLYRELIRMMEDSQVVVPVNDKERYEPVIGLYHQDVLESMERLFSEQNYTLPDLYKKIRFKGMSVGEHQPFSNPLIFTNINTFDDLTFLESLNHLPVENG